MATDQSKSDEDGYGGAGAGEDSSEGVVGHVPKEGDNFRSLFMTWAYWSLAIAVSYPSSEQREVHCDVKMKIGDECEEVFSKEKN